MSSYPKVDITTDTKFVGKKGDFLQNISIKQKIIGLITDKLRQCGCAVVQAENDADVDIVKSSIAVASSKSTTVVGEETEFHVLLLYYTVGIESFEIYLSKEHNISGGLKKTSSIAVYFILSEQIGVSQGTSWSSRFCRWTSTIFDVMT